MAWIGIGYRQQLVNWVDQHTEDIDCLEITAEHFFDGSHDQLRQLSADYPLFVHGLGLSLGTPGPLDQEILKNFKAVVEAAQPEWVSEHIAFTRTAEVDLGHLNPVAPNLTTLQLLVEHVQELAEVTAKPVILENITTCLQLQGELSETEFMNRLCEQSGCGLLLDVTNLYINAKNHKFDPIDWLHRLEPSAIKQLHVVGYSYRDNEYHDSHANPIQEDLLSLIQEVYAYATVSAVTLEWDSNFPSSEVLLGEIRKLQEVFRVI